MTRPAVVLVGPPGAGKSTVGEAVAARLNLPFRDTDRDVEAVAGKEVAAIFVDDGEERFRTLEREAVAAALDQHDGVVALGGGAVLAESTRALLREHTVVFLDVNLADAARRVGLGVARPLLLGNVRAQLSRLLEARRPRYAEVATLTVDTSGRSVDDVTGEIVAAVAG
ncbi:MAG: shikimate kinase [Actinomycetota bacterium]|nr:shikimate kinase [Actinomycetota bacterium]